jgi:hypothetical protein
MIPMAASCEDESFSEKARNGKLRDIRHRYATKQTTHYFSQEMLSSYDTASSTTVLSSQNSGAHLTVERLIAAHHMAAYALLMTLPIP